MKRTITLPKRQRGIAFVWIIVGIIVLAVAFGAYLMRSSGTGLKTDMYNVQTVASGIMSDAVSMRMAAQQMNLTQGVSKASIVDAPTSTFGLFSPTGGGMTKPTVDTLAYDPAAPVSAHGWKVGYAVIPGVTQGSLSLVGLLGHLSEDLCKELNKRALGTASVPQAAGTPMGTLFTNYANSSAPTTLPDLVTDLGLSGYSASFCARDGATGAAVFVTSLVN